MEKLKGIKFYERMYSGISDFMSLNGWRTVGGSIGNGADIICPIYSVWRNPSKNVNDKLHCTVICSYDPTRGTSTLKMTLEDRRDEMKVEKTEFCISVFNEYVYYEERFCTLMQAYLKYGFIGMMDALSVLKILAPEEGPTRYLTWIYLRNDTNMVDGRIVNRDTPDQCVIRTMRENIGFILYPYAYQKGGITEDYGLKISDALDLTREEILARLHYFENKFNAVKQSDIVQDGEV